MSKCTNESTVEDIIQQVIRNLYKEYKNSYKFEEECESHAFGDTYVNGNYYITEESEDKCFKAFKEDTTPEVVIESLYNNCDFSRKIGEIIKNFRG